MLVRWYLAYSLSYTNKAGIDTINLHLALLFMLGGLLVQLTLRQIKGKMGDPLGFRRCNGKTCRK
jgi:hypothetical protein